MVQLLTGRGREDAPRLANCTAHSTTSVHWLQQLESRADHRDDMINALAGALSIRASSRCDVLSQAADLHMNPNFLRVQSSVSKLQERMAARIFFFSNSNLNAILRDSNSPEAEQC